MVTDQGRWDIKDVDTGALAVLETAHADAAETSVRVTTDQKVGGSSPSERADHGCHCLVDQAAAGLAGFGSPAVSTGRKGWRKASAKRCG